MTVLSRYLVKQNLFLMFTILMISMGIYLLADFFERMNAFLSSDISLLLAISYFIAKLPSIISQLLPAVFLLALVIQLNILHRTNEMIALKAGGISPFVMLKFTCIYGLLWALMQLGFSQVLGVEGDHYASNIWKEQVRGRQIDETVSSLWFSEKNMVIHLDSANPKTGEGKGFIAYELSDDGLSFSTITKASTFLIDKNHWKLFDGSIANPITFSRAPFKSYEFPLDQDLKVFMTISSITEPKFLPLWELGKVITRLQAAGTNVEAYKVAWHGKIAYAGTIFVMGLVALVISQLTQNLYKGIGYSLLVIFFFYFLNKAANTFGDEGSLNPFIAAWGADGIIFCLGLGIFLYPIFRQKH